MVGKLLGRTTSAGRRRMSPFRLGATAIVVIAVVAAIVMNRNYFLTLVRPGQTFQIHFARDYRLQPDLSVVKVNFVPAGVVTDVVHQSDGTELVTVKVDDDIPAKLRTAPMAVIRPTTLLGGNYFIDLVPGGAPGSFAGTIQLDHTQLPVELNQVAGALQPSAVDGVQHSVSDLDQTLNPNGRAALDRLLADAPAALGPAGQVLSAARGTNPDRDLTNLVGGLESTASVLTAQQGQLDSVVTNLGTTSAVLANGSDALASAIASMPNTLHDTTIGLSDLDTSLVRLRDTSDALRPSVDQLDTALAHLSPVLLTAQPFLNQLNGLLVDAKPLVDSLVPVSQLGTGVLNDINGPVIDRVNGPIKDFILSPYHGTGPYAKSNTDQPMYKELAGAVTNLDKASSLFDPNGYAIAIQAGFGVGTLGGLPVNPQVFLDQILNQGKQNQGGR
jgi:phospholipid/cholesterol/gamma-HCH transport system substrate-binding protein